jgi:4-aminobutyrate aminotransferase-like enzyme
MLLLPASIFPTLRFIPPLTVQQTEIDMGLEIFEDALQDTVSQGSGDAKYVA